MTDEQRLSFVFPAPHSDIQRAIMHAFELGVYEIFVACGTKFGKTLAATVAMNSQALQARNRDQISRWVAPVYSQALIGFNYAKRLFPERADIVKPFYSKPPKIHLLHNNHTIEYWHGQKPINLEGEAVHRYVLDEYAKLKPEVYDAIRGTRTHTKGPLLGISTPYGKNHFYDKCMLAKEEMNNALKHGRIPRRMFIHAPTLANPTVSKEEVEDARKQMPARLFRQYYLAVFEDSGDLFPGLRQCLFPCRVTFETDSNPQRWIHPEAKQKRVMIGVDWAKQVDYTCFIAIDISESRPKVVGYFRSQGVSYRQSLGLLVNFGKEFETVELIYHDKTGVGEALDEMLESVDLPYEGVTFTNQRKAEMVNRLMVRVQDHEIALPEIPSLVAEMDSYEVEITTSGNMRYNAPSGKHDDIVCALMLALACYDDNAFETSRSRDIEKVSTEELESYYGKRDEDGDFFFGGDSW